MASMDAAERWPVTRHYQSNVSGQRDLCVGGKVGMLRSEHWSLSSGTREPRNPQHDIVRPFERCMSYILHAGQPGPITTYLSSKTIKVREVSFSLKFKIVENRTSSAYYRYKWPTVGWLDRSRSQMCQQKNHHQPFNHYPTLSFSFQPLLLSSPALVSMDFDEEQVLRSVI